MDTIEGYEALAFPSSNAHWRVREGNRPLSEALTHKFADDNGLSANTERKNTERVMRSSRAAAGSAAILSE